MISSKLSGATVALLLWVGSANADVSISNKPTQNMDCISGVCTATAQKAVLNVGELQTMLGTGDVSVKTGLVAKDITIDQPLSWTSTSRLTLDAQQSIVVKKPLSVAGTGALTITTNDGGSNGDLLFENKGSVTFSDLSSSLIVNGQSFALVRNLKDLASEISANPSGYYALTRNYDAGSKKLTSSPVGTQFTGTFEGLGHSVANLAIRSSTGCLGLFAATGSGAVVRDISLQSVDIAYVGGIPVIGSLIGCSLEPTIVTHAYADGAIKGEGKYENYGMIGGIVGLAEYLTLGDSHSNVVVSSASYAFVGGAVGLADFGSSVMRTISSGSVSAGPNTYAGGLVGYLQYDSDVLQSSATGNVDGLGAAGGLIGAGDGAVDQSYATGSVTSSDIVGGFAGGPNRTTNSYAIGAVYCTAVKCKAGGMFGVAGESSAEYSIGIVSGVQGSFLGGFAGKGDTLASGYWDTDSSGHDKGCGKGGGCRSITGLTDAQLKSGLPEGFDPAIWGSDPHINSGYPYLLANPPK